MARENLNGIKNKYHMHEAAKITLESLGKESTYTEIYKYIIDNNLFEFGAKKEAPEQILKRILERKSINTKSSTKTAEQLFYKVGTRSFGLLNWLSPQEIKELTIETENENFLLKNFEKLQNELNKTKIELEKLKEQQKKTENFDEKYSDFQNTYNKSHQENESLSELINKFTLEKENVENLLDTLEDNKHQLNFTRLERGFRGLLRKKEIEKKNLSRWLKRFGFTIIVIPILTILAILMGVHDLTYSIPLAVIEIFLVYYFRIFLHNYNSIEEQILQLENKSALLQFISHYIIYKKDNDIQQDDVSKFEEIIFSKISPNMKTIPTSPDVISLVEKIAKIFNKRQS